MSAFERYAIDRLIAQALDAGVDIPDEVFDAYDLAGHDLSYAARMWSRDHPDDFAVCCTGGMVKGPEYCTCWRPVYTVEQTPPRPPTGPEQIAPTGTMCGDCAFRPGSPERADKWQAEGLYESARTGVPFWCHQGMRRPDHWAHPDGRRVLGSPDDWQPPMVSGVPYQADGSPGRLCSGWAAVAAHHTDDTTTQVMP